jgi:hypothetical protein
VPSQFSLCFGTKISRTAQRPSLSKKIETSSKMVGSGGELEDLPLVFIDLVNTPRFLGVALNLSLKFFDP